MKIMNHFHWKNNLDNIVRTIDFHISIYAEYMLNASKGEEHISPKSTTQNNMIMYESYKTVIATQLYDWNF